MTATDSYSTGSTSQHRNIVVATFIVVVVLLMFVSSINVRTATVNGRYGWIEMNLLPDSLNKSATVMNNIMKSINVANI